ncbi:GNAT family N-acetyltransferase [Kordiimonas sp. SCSIO 12610]|uniref:GNAT family N-acetyltransferase n=1 Tax=Kordiimonas sp. SCSIO 12610 TaxID=2829597 RepID=UPI00210A41F1|nr:GNAT family protein [Kordiimonas sp. SCSIO 12610]UTW56649.1 GNAT family N-acetyltransferase [Kordiimonas sp. SCSIO 12610]
MSLNDWVGAPPPNLPEISGNYVTLRPYDAARDTDALYEAICGADDQDLWTYIPFHMPDSASTLSGALMSAGKERGWQSHSIYACGNSKPLGMASYMRIRPEHGSAEVGCIVFSKALQRTHMATEAIYLMIKHAFDDLGYRRFEWKCDNDNEASKRAAKRFGFTFEGIFRNDLVVKGRNRDTAWFSIIDREWPIIKAGFERWLDLNNFDEKGTQKQRLRFDP